jgi:ABC-type multidrug transport system fused ATPase/permease subunit
MLGHLNKWLPTDYPVILILGWLLVAVFLAKLCAALFVNFRVHHLCGLIEASLRSNMLSRYQGMPYGLWLQRNTSEYITAVNAQVPTFVQMLVATGLRALSDGVVALVVLAFLAYTDWRAFLIILLMLGGIAFGYDRVFRVRLGKIGAEQRLLTIRMTTSVRHAMEGLKELRVLGVEPFFTEHLRQQANQFALRFAKSQTIGRMPRYLAEFGLIIFVVLTVTMTWWLVATTEQLTAVFGVFALGAMRLMPAASSLMAFTSQLRLQRNLVHHLAKDWRDLDQKASDHPCAPAARSVEPFNELAVEALHFRYPGAREDAICGINLSLRAGESIAFIGTSGSGKTTLVDIMLGLLESQSGEILVNGKPLRDDRRRLLDHVAYLPQNVFLIDDTLRRNVALGTADEDIDDARVIEALRQAQLSELVERSPNGLDTFIGDRGVMISGGQRQRVSLARAFYYRKSIIVMDEATSALDHETEREIVEEINLLKGKTTLIVIAHRLSTVQDCDRIYKLEHGKIVQSGTFRQIVHDPINVTG